MFITSHDSMKTALNFNTFKSTKLTATTTGISNYTNSLVKTLDTHAHSFIRPVLANLLHILQHCRMQWFASSLSTRYLRTSETAERGETPCVAVSQNSKGLCAQYIYLQCPLSPCCVSSRKPSTFLMPLS